jgi:hypothetical protein
MNAAQQARALTQSASAHTPASLTAIAANMMTAGQFIGVLLAMLAGVLVITSEFAHHTATTTFLTTPRRDRVIAAKLAASASFGALLWLTSTVIDVAVTPLDLYPHGWILGAPVVAPAVASTVMITPEQAFPHAPPQWTGLIIMAGYTLALAIAGVGLTRRRDVT